MKKIKLTALFCWMLLLAMLLSACTGTAGRNPADTTVDASANDPSDTEPTVLPILKSGKMLYRIIIPQDVSSMIMTEVNNMEADLKGLIGIRTQIGNDVTNDGKPMDSAGEIIIGECLRNDTLRALSGHKYKDYVLKVTANDIVIAAYDDQSLKSAIRAFRDALKTAQVVRDGKNLTLKWDHSINKTEDSGTYNVNTCTLGGADISDAVIVYPKGSELVSQAKSIRTYIGNSTGAVLPVVDDGAEESANEILVGKTNRALSKTVYEGASAPAEMQYRFVVDGGKMQVASGGLFSIDYAVKTISKNMSGKSVKMEKFSDLGLMKVTDDTAPAKSGDYRIMTYNVLNGGLNWGADGVTIPYAESIRVEIVANIIKQYAPDVICIQELFEEWVKYLPAAISEYTFTDIFMRSDGRATRVPIAYNAQKLKVVNSGYVIYPDQDISNRMMVWVLFENKTNGEQFVVMNTHLSAQTVTGDKDQYAISLRQLQETKLWNDEYDKIIGKYTSSIPVIAAGDWNCRKQDSIAGDAGDDSAPIKDITSHTGLEFANDATIDHILYSKNRIEFKNVYANITTFCAGNGSDHRPQVFDFSIKK